jgi:hypothetical protein
MGPSIDWPLADVECIAQGISMACVMEMISLGFGNMYLASTENNLLELRTYEY